MKKLANPNLPMWHPLLARLRTDFTSAEHPWVDYLHAGAM